MRVFFYIISLVFTLQSGFANYRINQVAFAEAEILNQYTARIPFQLIDNLIVVKAELLGQKGNFIIDTGSEALILNNVHFPAKYAHNKKRQKMSGVVSIIDNPFERKLNSFVIENLVMENQTSDVIDLSHIETSKKIKLLGVIGYSILKDYEVFVDLYLNQITLSKTDNNGTKLDPRGYLEKIVDSVGFQLKNHTIVVNASINGHPLTFGVDTAAEVNQINHKAPRKALKYFLPKGRILLTGASNRQIEVLAGNLHRVKLSKSVYLGPMQTILTNLDNLNKAFGTSLDGILGYEFFKQKRTIINYKKEKLYFVQYPLQLH
ncbi:retropepsin-like domain-containing protein [Mangrovimonas sp. TPBH4]|uniref:retropepsin-like domain-containing protein n=1 Tax=Mangrovimonas sp. TPBH4 TaxID=1645914 RepID=UPI0006B5B9E1|nr:retropepsin-like domain-containing protein [Mangrovimonas sp. TPBH4]